MFSNIITMFSHKINLPFLLPIWAIHYPNTQSLGTGKYSAVSACVGFEIYSMGPNPHSATYSV